MDAVTVPAGGGLADELAAAVAAVHVTVIRSAVAAREVLEAVAVAAREAFEAVAVAARTLVEAMGGLIGEFRAWRKVLRRRVLWLDRGRPARLCIDGHAYRRRRARRGR